RVPLASVCVFAGSNPGRNPAYEESAAHLGRVLALRGIELVTGGGRVGLMGTVADAALEAGGRVTGVIPRDLADLEIAHRGLSELLVVDSMHARKLAMSDRAQAFIALPGGFGTLEEVMEAFTWTQLGIHAKPVGVLDVAGFFGPLLRFLDSVVDAGFVHPAHRSQFLAAAEPDDLLEEIRRWEPTTISKWLGPEDR
ncbi:MAG TPA: TIGR00730 family Rossman fold protein, partial [Acidimicrobiales bacterium]|nr:TIGR00730 family Rossman fold protein [Acidimicrobiales bacterium]